MQELGVLESGIRILHHDIQHIARCSLDPGLLFLETDLLFIKLLIHYGFIFLLLTTFVPSSLPPQIFVPCQIAVQVPSSSRPPFGASSTCAACASYAPSLSVGSVAPSWLSQHVHVALNSFIMYVAWPTPSVESFQSSLDAVPTSFESAHPC